MFTTEAPSYLLFINNWEEKNNVKQQLNSNLDIS